MTKIKDLVLVYIEDAPLSFARVENILPDAKKDWYHIKLLMLQIPLQVITWILKDAYINGEPFHMNGKKMKLEKVEIPGEDPVLSGDGDGAAPEDKKENQPGTKAPAEIISFSKYKKET